MLTEQEKKLLRDGMVRDINKNNALSLIVPYCKISFNSLWDGILSSDTAPLPSVLRAIFRHIFGLISTSYSIRNILIQDKMDLMLLGGLDCIDCQ